MSVRFSEEQLAKITARKGYTARDQSAPGANKATVTDGKGHHAPGITIAGHSPNKRRAAGHSKLELRFDQQLAARDIPAPQKNYLFLPNRDLELDRAWPAWKLGVEIQGGAHRASQAMLDRDCEKLCLALLAGWWILPFSKDLIRSERSIELLFSAIDVRRRMAVRGLIGRDECRQR